MNFKEIGTFTKSSNRLLSVGKQNWQFEEIFNFKIIKKSQDRSQLQRRKCHQGDSRAKNIPNFLPKKRVTLCYEANIMSVTTFHQTVQEENNKLRWVEGAAMKKAGKEYILL